MQFYFVLFKYSYSKTWFFFLCKAFDQPGFRCMFIKHIQWNTSYEANPFAPEMWPFKRGRLSTGVNQYICG